MKSLILVLMILLALAAQAQQRREPLTVVVALAPAGAGHTYVLVRVYNRSWRTINLFVPNHMSCTALPGTVTLKWAYEGATDYSHRAVLAIRNVCQPALNTGQWEHLAPGAYVEVHNIIQTGRLVQGRYEIHAVYTAPHFDADERSQLRYAGIETAKGQYKSGAYQFMVGE